MSTNQLKKLIIGKIDDLDDAELLNAIYKLMDYNSSEGKIYKTNNEQKSAISMAQEQIKNGDYTSNEDLEKEIDKWLSE